MLDTPERAWYNTHRKAVFILEKIISYENLRNFTLSFRIAILGLG